MIRNAPIVVALGGNAISPLGGQGTIEQQFDRTTETAALLAEIAAEGPPLLVTHGNGPQVGSVLRRVELAASRVYRLPLHICVADTQGGMGYMICQCLNGALHLRGIDRRAATLVTTVEVDDADPAFQKPTKPIGDLLSAEEADRMRRDLGWKLTRINDKGFRRVVPSPHPRAILEIDVIRRLVADGQVLVAGGGGGVPVIRLKDGQWRGVDAVIDKDRTSALLAREIEAHAFVIATGVERVALDFDTPQQRELSHLTLDEAREHLAAGQFPPGSMGPKIEAAIDFLAGCEDPDAHVLICNLEHLAEALRGDAGTRITR